MCSAHSRAVCCRVASRVVGLYVGPPFCGAQTQRFSCWCLPTCGIVWQYLIALCVPFPQPGWLPWWQCVAIGSTTSHDVVFFSTDAPVESCFERAPSSPCRLHDVSFSIRPRWAYRDSGLQFGSDSALAGKHRFRLTHFVSSRYLGLRRNRDYD